VLYACLGDEHVLPNNGEKKDHSVSPAHNHEKELDGRSCQKNQGSAGTKHKLNEHLCMKESCASEFYWILYVTAIFNFFCLGAKKDDRYRAMCLISNQKKG
jgi:hypothetical protein